MATQAARPPGVILSLAMRARPLLAWWCRRRNRIIEIVTALSVRRNTLVLAMAVLSLAMRARPLLAWWCRRCNRIIEIVTARSVRRNTLNLAIAVLSQLIAVVLMRWLGWL